MKKVIILMPVFNDWESADKVLKELNTSIQELNGFLFKCIIVNDCSSINRPKIMKPENFESLKIINMKENRGHARCNAFALRYISSKFDFDYVVVMDSDGEDRPEEIKYLIEKVRQNPKNSVVAKRIKRSEGLIFKSLYEIHKFITLIFTGKKINFGNYSCLTKNDVIILSEQGSLWSSFSGTVKKNLKDLQEINSIRGLRYFGPSKMSLFNLAIHSFSIIAVFKYNVLLRSLFLILILFFISKNFLFISTIFQIFVIIFNLIIFSVSFRENESALVESDENILNEENITH